MKSRDLVVVLMGAVWMCNPGCALMDDLRPARLRCEYAVNPLGIDVTEPRLSWIVESGQRGQRQTAYRILVASSEENLDAGNADLWDSGKVVSDETVHVAYAGKPLHTGQRAH